MKFADIIIPLNLPNLFTYFIPNELRADVAPGRRVVIPFGRGKLYTGIIKNLHDNTPEKYQAKAIECVLDDKAIVTAKQLDLWDWVSTYYLCGIGEVMQMALPSGFKLVSETKILLNNPDENPANLTDYEYLIFEALQLQGVLSIQEISAILGIKSVHPIIKSLLEKNVVVLEEELLDKYSVKSENYLQLNYQKYPTIDALSQVFKLLSKSPKQEDALLRFTTLKHFDFENFKIKKSQFSKTYNFSTSVINQLIQKEIFNELNIQINRLTKFEGTTQELPQLNDAQQLALKAIKEGFIQQKPVLLHGVTGSGKTEVYLHLIQDALNQQKSVLYLLPEIALTTQLITRLQKVFGDKVGVYHSKFNLNERVELWNDLLEEQPKHQIIIGARSSLFLPFKNLGLIVVDEEHESTFKQHDPAPRYHARDTAIYLAYKEKTPIILGSATPSVDSYFNAQSNKYLLVELKKRYGGIAMPEILCADIKKEKKQKLMKGLFSNLLIEQVKEAFEHHEQVILFQNRRGFAPILECSTCGHVEKCVRCDVSLTYHKHANLLRCHYCGHTQNLQISCSACGSVETDFKGSGTEQIEEEFGKLFPTAKLARLDLDTTKRKNAYQEIITDFEDRNIDVLIGTQMLTKGLDFDHVSVVGILNADQMLSYPDFRSFERAFQLMLQVAGRAGRRKKRGKVIIQTYNPYHAVIRNVIDYDYLSLYNSEILIRKNFIYPPFYRLISITFKDKNKNLLDAAAAGLSTAIQDALKSYIQVLGPEYPSIARINNYYHKKTLIKISKGAPIHEVKKIIQHWINVYKNDKSYRNIRYNVDVDPQ